MVGDRLGLQLKGRVRDRNFEVFNHTIPNVTQHRHGVSVLEALVANYDVRAQRGQPSGHGGCVNVMHIDYMLELENVCPHVLKVQAFGSELHENTASLTHQHERAGDDESGDEYSCESICLLKPRRRDDDGRDDDTE